MTDILVVRLSALGDVIHTIPAVVGLPPEAKVKWVVEAPYRELVEIVAGVEAVPIRMKAWGRALWQSRTEIRNSIRNIRADRAIDFQGLIKSAALPWVARVPERIGFAAPRERMARWFTNEHVEVDTTAHVIEQNIQLAIAAGGSRGGRANWNAFTRGGEEYRGSIVLLPGAGKPNKLWPIDRFRVLADVIGERAVVVWGPGEQELAEQIGARMAPPTNLRELAGILRHADAVVGADTGPLHLAAALGTRVVGLYGPTNPRRNGPFGQLGSCIDKFVTTKLMHSITVEEVMTALRRITRA